MTAINNRLLMILLTKFEMLNTRELENTISITTLSGKQAIGFRNINWLGTDKKANSNEYLVKKFLY